MSPEDHASLAPWWWLLAGLIGVGMLMSVLRAWLDARQRDTTVRNAAAGAPLLVPLPPRTSDHPPEHPPEHAPEHTLAPPAGAVPSKPTAAALRPAVAQIQDPVTGLGTRLWLEDQLAAAVMRAEARQRRLALLYIDLDGFKPLCEALGDSGGEALLREVGQRLASMGRATDAMARMGGDAFLMLLDGDPDTASAALVAERLRGTLQQPCTLYGRTVRLSCSIGIVMYPDHGPRAKLIARADAAMMAAKRAGGDMHCFFDVRMEHDADGAADLQRDLRQAIDTGEGLALHYQPKVDGRTGAFRGAEALLRWRHPDKGMLAPALVIPVAERFGLIGALGLWVIDEACRQVREWMDMGSRLRVSINLSGHQLRQSDLVDRVQALLDGHGVPPELISLEVSETAAMADPKATLRLFERFAEIGVQLAIDDFGTGYSSLSELRKLPARQLKIDHSFVQGLGQDEDARAIVRAAVKLAHALGLTVVAEGVETAAQQAILRELGCDEMQGFLFARPMPAGELGRWARAAEAAASPGKPRPDGAQTE